MENDFNNIINDSINKASQGLSSKIDVHLLTDLKRMSELGVLEIQQEQPEIMPFDESKASISITQKIRIYFKGEDTIKSQQKQIEELKAENEKFKGINEALKECTFLNNELTEENTKLKESNITLSDDATKARTAYTKKSIEVDKLKERVKELEQPTITDGDGNYWSKTCPECNYDTMQIVRIGKVQCAICN